MRGFLDLAWRLGLLLAQLDDGSPRSCSIAYRGEIASRNTRLVTAAFAAGLLESAIEDVNIVNAEMLLRDRGIELVEQSRSDPGAFSSVVAVDLVAGDRVHRAAGTLFGHSMPRLVQLEGHRLEAYLDGTLLVFTHQVLACPGVRSARVVKLPAAGQLPFWLAASAAASRSARVGQIAGARPS